MLFWGFSVFRGLVLTVFTVCLAGCSETNANPQNLTTISGIPDEFSFAVNAKCKFKNAKFNVFGKKTQSLSFNYQQCPNAARRQFTLIGNNEVIDKVTGRSLLVVGKQGPDSEKEYMEKMAYQADPEKCTVMQTDENFWVLIGESYDNPYSGGIVGHQPQSGLYETACDHYEGFWGPKGWVFKFEEGIVFGIRLENINDIIDLSSVTYINQG